jgi:hypoxanthine-guanine phosphoribosyltransferase
MTTTKEATKPKTEMRDYIPFCIARLRREARRNAGSGTVDGYERQLRDLWIEQFNPALSQESRDTSRAGLNEVFIEQVEAIANLWKVGSVHIKNACADSDQIPNNPILVPIMVAGYDEGLRIAADLKIVKRSFDVVLLGYHRFASRAESSSRCDVLLPKKIHMHEDDRRFLISNPRRHVLLIDDVCATGETANAIASELWAMGHRDISLLSRSWFNVPKNFSLELRKGEGPLLSRRGISFGRYLPGFSIRQ